MAPRSRERALLILGPFLRRLALCMERAWQDLEAEISALIRAEMSPRTRAAFLNDRIKLHARREFQDDPRVGFRKGRGGLMVLAICNEFLLRFKKLKPNLKTSNIPTQQSINFSGQKELELPDTVPAMTHVNAGYILNRMQTQIASTHLTCPVATHIGWSIDMASVLLGELVPMPEGVAKPKGGTSVVGKTTTSQPKRTAEKREGEDEDGDNDGDTER